MIYLQLFLSFLQIGMFSFGGGYAAMPEKESRRQKRNGMTLLAVLLIVTCVLIILAMNGMI